MATGVMKSTSWMPTLDIRESNIQSIPSMRKSFSPPPVHPLNIHEGGPVNIDIAKDVVFSRVASDKKII